VQILPLGVNNHAKHKLVQEIFSLVILLFDLGEIRDFLLFVGERESKK
jgi:hypothetical protein